MRAFLGMAALWASATLAQSPQVINGRVVHVTKDTPVFSLPAAKSKILADVDHGAVLIVREISPMGTWLMVEDEDRNQGWVPSKRTDYVNMPTGPDPKSPADKKPKTPDEDLPDHEAVQVVDAFKHLPALTVRASRQDANGEWGMGFTYSLFTPPAVSMGRESRTLYTGFQFGFLKSSAGDGRRGFTIPLRMRMLGRASNSHFAFGPDLGILYMHRSAPSPADSFISISLGYSVGWVPYTSGLLPWFRLGVDFLHATRLSFELGLGWLL